MMRAGAARRTVVRWLADQDDVVTATAVEVRRSRLAAREARLIEAAAHGPFGCGECKACAR